MIKPTPGRIHQLPVKVLYSLDGTDQSYVTVLHETQDVYVHPGFPGYASSDDEPGPVGSTYLKCIAQGVCYASPECVPSSNALDFSVYNLDPSPSLRSRTHAQAQTQPFTSNSNAAGSTSTSHQPSPRLEESSWTGKGFLSWAMAEPQHGSTLAKGRLTSEYDFEPSRFQHHSNADGGGLEALMRSGGAGGNGRGWGLEVVISLKLVNPAGKGEYSGRREFERMLFSGNGQSATGGSVLVGRSSPVRPPPAPAQSASARRHNGNSSAPTPTPTSTQPPARPPLPAARSSGPQHQQQHASASASSVQNSSIPMNHSSSAGPSGIAGPSRNPAPSNTSNHATAPAPTRPAFRPPPAPTPPAPASSSNGGNGPSSTNTTPQKTRHSRQVTPPPLPRPKSPPPTTPHRRALRDLLQADGKMSPSLAKELVNNPSLIALLKSVPAVNKSEGSGAGAAGGIKAEEETDRSRRDETPTPTAPRSATRAPAAPASAPAPNVIPGGCSNCGTTETSLWRSKVYPDGTMTKVCDDCGVYFNKNKRMRPKELWDTTTSGNGKKAKGGTPTHQPTPPPPQPPHGVRQSPRLSRNHNNNNTSPSAGPSSAPSFPPIHESPSKRRRTASNKPVPQPSPRMATRSSSARTDGGEMQPFPFSQPPSASAGNGDPGQEQGQDQDGLDLGDIDLDAILAQINGGNTTGDPNTQGISLEDLFANADQAAQNDDALAEDMMKFLAGLENDVEPAAGANGESGDGDATGQGENAG